MYLLLNLKMFMFFFLLVLQWKISASQDANIRLVNGTYGSHMGRFEVLYNDTWGSICNSRWNYNDARVACRSLGFISVVCPILAPSLPPPPEGTPVWMTNLACNGRERSLAQCNFEGYGVESCEQVGGEAICVQSGIVGKTLNVTQVDEKPYSVNITWLLPSIPEGVSLLRWRISGFPGSSDIYIRTNTVNITTYSYLASNLAPGSTYNVRVRTDIHYHLCSGYLWGVWSDEVVVRTVAAAPRVSNISLRLVPPYPNMDFLGRLEVLYNGTWGTVCDHHFGLNDAHVMCSGLNFSRALCSVPRGRRFGQGAGPIWMDNVACEAQDEILEDCDFNGWGIHNCRHALDVSIVCQPNDYSDPVEGLRVIAVTSNTIRIRWNPFTFPPGTSISRYRIKFKLRNSRNFQSLVVSSSLTMATIRRLTFNSGYNISVQAQYRFICGQLLTTPDSQSVFATTVEKAPSGPPTSVHVITLNNTAIEIQWNLPLFNLRNGVIRGFKVFYGDINSDTEVMINVTDNSATEYIVDGLQPNTAYRFSVLAYTNGDGPRSILLTISTFSADYVELIVRFGPNGNGRDRVVRRLDRRNLNVHCGSGISDVQLTWFFSNGTEVPYSDRDVRQGTNNNEMPTSILQIGASRTFQYCDAGTYTCRAVWSINNTIIEQNRSFILLIGTSPPSPSSPYIVAVGSTWVTLGWYELSCDGGHSITEFVIRYRKEVPDYYVSSYSFVYGVDPSARNHTIYNLVADTAYNFAIQALSAEFRPSNFSVERLINTLIAVPSPPLDVTARLVQTPVVEISWSEPANANGIIVYYTVYADAPRVAALSINNQETDISLNGSLRVPGHIGTVNMTVTGSHSNFHFQVSATINVYGVYIEGERSQISQSSTVFVPVDRLPIPRNVQISQFTNTSVTLMWAYPMQIFPVAIQKFKVTYTANVFWVSPGGTLVRFSESRSVNVSSSLLTIILSQLIPDTEYRFQVSAVTEYGQGEEVIVFKKTAQAYDGRLGYFQLMIRPIQNCFRWKLQPSTTTFIQNSLVRSLNSICSSCAVSSLAIQAPILTCNSTAVDQAVFSSRIVGTNNISSHNLINLLQDWVLTETATVNVDGEDYQIDSTCPTFLDSQTAPVCTTVAILTTVTALTSSSTTPSIGSPSTTGSPSPSRSLHTTTNPVVIVSEQKGGMSSAAIGGLVIGVIIALLLVVFIVLLITLLMRSFWSVGSNRMKNFSNEKTEESNEHYTPAELKYDNPFYMDDENI